MCLTVAAMHQWRWAPHLNGDWDLEGMRTTPLRWFGRFPNGGRKTEEGTY